MKRIYFQLGILFILCCGIFSALDARAQIGWKWGLSNLNNNNSGFDVTVATIDDSGNVIVAGSTGAEAGPGIMNYMVFGADTVYGASLVGQQILIKADSNGHFVWAKGAPFTVCTPIDIVADHSGNVYEFGYYGDGSCSFDTVTLLNPALYIMYCIIKYSPAGNVVWAKNIIGNTRNDEGAMGIDGAGNVYVAGGFDLPSVTIGGVTLINTSPPGDTFDVFVAKYDTLGNPIWAKSFGGHHDDWPNAMTVTPGGNIYISGSYRSSSLTVGSSVLTDSLVSGAFPETLPFLVKMDSSGHVIWGETQNSRLYIYWLTCDNLENIYMVGYMDSSIILGADTLTDAGGSDVFLSKYDSSGSVVWANSAGGPLHDYGYSIALDNCNHLWIAGGPSSPSGSEIMNFNGHTLALPGGADPSFVAEYNDSGIYITSIAVASGGDDYLGVLPDNRGNIYIGGDYKSSSLVFGPDTLGYTVSSFTINEELMIAKYRYDTTGCASITGDTSFNHIDTVVCAISDTFNITLTAPPGTGYHWYDGATTSTHIVYSSGIYWVSFIVAPDFIVDTFYVTFAHTTPPCASITGVNEISARSLDDISVFPNPAASQLTITSETPINQITVTNLLGQTVFSNNCNTEKAVVDVANLPGGVYFVKVNGSEVRKFVKE